jgi:lipopolysaccharide export system protein LptA
MMLVSTPANAQVSGKAFEGFQGNSKDPVQIEADELEVVDAESKAIFKGNVKVRQGSSLITTSKLTVHYLKGSDGGQGDMDKLVMTGGLVVTSKDNTVVANNGTYDVKTDIVVLTGKVVISQGKNIAKGNKLVANLKTNKAVLSGGRVMSIFTPSSAKKKK